MIAPGRFRDKVALVTGGATGIGAATAERLAVEGAAVGLLARDEGALGIMAEQLRAGGARALPLCCDVRSSSQVRKAVSELVAAFGGIDFVVNAAGVLRYAPVVSGSEHDWDDVLDTNLKGPMLLAKFAIPELKARGGGAVVNIASMLSFTASKLTGSYSASKAAVVALTRTLALEHAADGVRVTCVAPGAVRTPLLASLAAAKAPNDPERALRDLGLTHPIGRLIEPAEVASLILFLLSDEASAITGSCHYVDGGRLATMPS